MVCCAVQWTGFCSTVWGLFILASTSSQMYTVAVLCIGGTSLLVTGAVGFVLARKQRPLLSSVAVAAACAVEGYELYQLLSLHDAAYRFTSALIVGLGHGVPLLACVLLYAIMKREKARLAAKINASADIARRVAAAASNPAMVAAVERMQKVVRNYRSRKFAIRRRCVEVYVLLSRVDCLRGATVCLSCLPVLCERGRAPRVVVSRALAPVCLFACAP